MSTPTWFDRPRDAVTVVGADAETYLHGQISQDVKALAAAGTPAWTFVLEPNGKLGLLARIRRVDAGFLLDTDPGWGDALIARLRRFRIRVKADIEPAAVRFIALRGNGRAFSDPASDVIVPSDAILSGRELVPAAAAAIDAVAIDAAAFERLRVEAGWPAMGAELVEGTIPAESGVVTLAASFTKGCYTGQELVERMDSRRAAAPHVVRRLRASPGCAIVVGSDVQADGVVVGVVTSSVGDLALASLARRGADAGEGSVVTDASASIAVTIEAVEII